MSRASSADIAARAWRSPRHPGRLTSTCPAGGGSYHTDRHPGSRQATVKCPQMARSRCSVWAPRARAPLPRHQRPARPPVVPVPAPLRVGQSSRRTLTYTIRTLFLADRQRRRSAHPVISSRGSSHTGTPAGRRLAPPETTTGTASSRPIPASPPTRPFSCPARGGTAVSPAGVLILAGRAVLAEDPSRGDRARVPEGSKEGRPGWLVPGGESGRWCGARGEWDGGELAGLRVVLRCPRSGPARPAAAGPAAARLLR